MDNSVNVSYTDLNVLFDVKNSETDKYIRYNGNNIMEQRCFNCGRIYFISKDVMSVCAMPCPFCGVDICNPC